MSILVWGLALNGFAAKDRAHYKKLAYGLIELINAGVDRFQIGLEWDLSSSDDEFVNRICDQVVKVESTSCQDS